MAKGNALTNETPGKVFGLLGAALVSMFFMLAVTLTNASFQGVETPLPQPFSQDKVMATLDVAANSYSNYFAQVLVQPAVESYALAADNINYLSNEATDQLALYMGPASADQASSAPAVAGASTNTVYSGYYPYSSWNFGVNINTLYSLLIHS